MEPIPNPLKRFPVKRDSTLKAFSGNDVKRHSRRLEETQTWLNPLQVDPSFGIQGSGEAASLRRSYRRIQSSNLFVNAKPEDALLTEIVDKSNAKKKRLILVEESRLAEFYRYEEILRQEKKRLEDQCLFAVEPHLGIPLVSPPHLPIPATRLAIHSACESEMKKYALEIADMNDKWRQFRSLNHYDRPHLMSQTAQLQSLPIGLRLMKLNSMESESHAWLLRKEQDTMSYEDDVGHLVQLYHTAQQRKVDYDRYFILATRYGAWTEEAFTKNPSPGNTYWKRVQRGAIKFQGLWVKYWTFTKVKRYHAAVLIQAIWRGYWKYKKLNPIIKLRMRVGRRAAFSFCWGLWWEYIQMCRRIKSALSYMMIPWHKRCFDAWAKHTEEVKQKKEASLRKFILRMKNLELAGLFLVWVAWVQKRNKTKKFMRRLLQFPQFDMWVEYVMECKALRKLDKAASIIQACIRGFVMRRRYQRMKTSMVKLYYFALIILAKNETKRRRIARFELEYSRWKPQEETRRHDKATENERRRLIRQQQVVQDREFKILAELKKHLASSSGHLQLTEFALDIKEGLFSSTEIPSNKLSPMEALREIAAKELIKQCKHTERSLEKHEFNVKNPPFIKCADPKCSAVFTSADQYHMHVKKAKIHQDRSLLPAAIPANSSNGFPLSTKVPMEDNPLCLFSHYHLLLRHKQGSSLLMKYISRVHGECVANQPALVNCVDMWLSIQEWRRTSCHIENLYNNKAFAIMDSYLLPQSPKPLLITAKPDAPLVKSVSRGLVKSIRSIPGISSVMDPATSRPATNASSSWWPFRKAPSEKSKPILNDFHEMENQSTLESLESLVERLSIARKITSKSQFESCEARLSLWRKLMRLPPEVYDKWSDAHKVPASAFDVIEWYCFRTVFTTIALDAAFIASPEYEEYKQLLAADASHHETTLRHDYSQVRYLDLRRWTSQFKFVEMAISKKADDIISTMLLGYLPRQLGEYVASGVGEHVAEVAYEEQVRHEANMMVVDEAIAWVAMACVDDIYQYYLPALLKQMMEMPEMKKKLLIFTGLIEDTTVKKKLFVDMNVSTQKHKATFGQFLSEVATSSRKESSSPKPKHRSPSPDASGFQ